MMDCRIFFRKNVCLCLGIFLELLPGSAVSLRGETARTITQYGITWTFDKPYPAGQFVTGDYWVVGPAKIVNISPAPGQALPDTFTDEVKSRYGAVAMRDNNEMRNGSMIVLKPDRNQGYDSRLRNYDPGLSIQFPCTLLPDQSLISTVSNEAFPVPVLLTELMWASEKQAPLVLRSAAILTCLDHAPPPDAFRPPYAGKAKPLFTTGNLHWDKLPTLNVPAQTPPFEQFEKYLERPWLDHVDNWMFQFLGPSENQPNYGREFSRVTSIASLMLMLDVPKERKERLLCRLVQLGIDLYGLAQSGRSWNADGGFWSGRKWPILFAGLMLDEPEFLSVAKVSSFSEDQQTYYGNGWFGQTTLFQMVAHTGPQPPYEELRPEKWDAGNRKSESYRIVISPSWPGTALAVQMMKARQLWNHDAFFDYCDRWMALEDHSAAKRSASPRPKQEGKSLDPFVDAMWANYRRNVPAQPKGETVRKWVWNEDRKSGRFIANSRPRE